MNNALIFHNTTLIIGLSGGPDSVYLLHKLVELRTEYSLTIIAAHLDHEWRAESKDDALFCKQVCEQLQVSFVSKKISELSFSAPYNGSKEAYGRALRRHFLEKVAQQYNASSIVLAHHKDDQIETFLMRLIRGSSLEGLSAIKEIDGLYIRPLLQTSKADILTYLAQNNVPFVTDASNTSHDYLRNRLRLQAIPALEQCDARFSEKCFSTIQRIQEAHDFVQSEIDILFATIFDTTTQQLNLSLLRTLHPYAQKSIIMKWLLHHQVAFYPSENFLQEIIKFLYTNKGGSHQLGTSWKIIKKQHKATIVTSDRS